MWLKMQCNDTYTDIPAHVIKIRVTLYNSNRNIPVHE